MTLPTDTPAPPLSLGRRVLFTGVYLGMLGAFLVLGVELISRFVFARETMAIYITSEIGYDPKAGWRGTRNFSASTAHGRYPVPVQVDINADGFRDASWDAKLSRARARGSKKVVIVGDSLLYGWANPVDGRLSEQLLARYQLAGANVEVFNAGIPAYGPHNELRLLPEILARIEPQEVVLLFCSNDYGDAALPYDYRYPFRVYQPFFGPDAQLLFNDPVPRRPSLVMRDTPLGRLRLWYAVDQLRYALEDRRYARYGIPNARTAPVHSFDDLFGQPALRSRFPYIETTLLAEYKRMAELSRNAGARFTFFSSTQVVPPSWEPVEALFGAKLRARGVPLLLPPDDAVTYGRWGPTLRDGHPNFVWAWIMANGLYAYLEGRPYQLDFGQMPHTRDIPTELDLGNEAACARFIGMGWELAGGGERRLSGPASFFLRNPAPGASTLEIVGWASRPTRLIAVGPRDREICRFTLTTPVAAYTCPIDPKATEPIVFVHLLPEANLEPEALPVLRRVSLR
jgi:hypothetical protein